MRHLCFSFGHTAPQCAQFRSSGQQPPTHLAVGIVYAPTWFPDTSANQHVMPDLATLTDSAPYLGNDYSHVGDDKGLSYPLSTAFFTAFRFKLRVDPPPSA